MISRKDVMYQHMIAFQGVDVLFNDDNTTTKVLITECEDSNENNYDLKNVITDRALKQGDYINIDDTIYMVIDTKKVNESSYTMGTFRKALKITLESNLKDIYAVIDKVKGVYAEGQQITEVHDEYSFIVPKDSCDLTSATPADNAIIYAGGSYDAISIDDSKEGILIITGRLKEVYNPHIYAISLSSNDETLEETGTYQISATCTDNGIIQTNPIIEYASSDENIASISSSGVVSALKSGSCNITVTYMNVSATLSLTITAKQVEPVISYTENWSQTTTIKQYVTSTYTVTKIVEGVSEVPTISYTFDSAGQALISAGKMVVTNKASNSFSVKNSTITTTTTCYVIITDTADDHIIATTLLTFKPMS